jgi:hypothetical protein
MTYSNIIKTICITIFFTLLIQAVAFGLILNKHNKTLPLTVEAIVEEVTTPVSPAVSTHNDLRPIQPVVEGCSERQLEELQCSTFDPRVYKLIKHLGLSGIYITNYRFNNAHTLIINIKPVPHDIVKENVAELFRKGIIQSAQSLNDINYDEVTDDLIISGSLRIYLVP